MSSARCIDCRAPRGHPPAVCVGCGREYAHVSGLDMHYRAAHGIRSPRSLSLLLEAAKFQLRGWPPSRPTADLLALLKTG